MSNEKRDALFIRCIRPNEDTLIVFSYLLLSCDRIIPQIYIVSQKRSTPVLTDNFVNNGFPYWHTQQQIFAKKIFSILTHAKRVATLFCETRML